MSNGIKRSLGFTSVVYRAGCPKWRRLCRSGRLRACYKASVAPISHGVAYGLWRLVQERAAELGLNGVQLAERVGLRRPTIDGLRQGSRSPQPRIIDKLVDGLGLDRREAYRLAGRIPPDQPAGSDDIRAALARSPYTKQQQNVLLGVLDAFDAANRATDDRVGTDADERDSTAEDDRKAEP